jgi:hypothetical protein
MDASRFMSMMRALVWLGLFGLATPAWANSPPVAVDDNAATHVGVAVVVNATANDSDPDGDPVTIVDNPVVTNPPIVPPAHGSWRKLSSSTLEYTPVAGYTGSDAFQYEIGDGNGARRRAYVYVTIGNQPPVAVDDNAATHVGVAVVVNATANDSDPDGDPVTIVDNPVVTNPPIVPPAHGSWRKLSGSTLEYTPVAGYTGSDAFQYEIGDGNGARRRAYVNVGIGNSPPQALPDQATVATGGSVLINVVANDLDPDGDTLSLIGAPVVVAPAHGQAVKVSGTSIQYTPGAGYVGSDQFTYEVGDGNGGRSRATVAITVRAESFTLSITPASRNVTIGQSTTFTVSATGSGGFSGSIALSAASLPTGVSASFNPAAIGPGQSAQLSLSASSNAITGTSTLRVNGASAGLTATTNASLTVLAPAGVPAISSMTPDLMQHGLVDVTLQGQNFNGARVEVGDEIAPGVSNGRFYPVVSIVSAPAGGSRLNLRIDARDTRIEGWYSLYVRTPAGVAGVLFRVVGAGPVLDYASPGDVVPGQRFAFMMIGANLDGASISASSPDIDIIDVENSNPEALMGYLSVRAGAPVGEFNLNIARNGHVEHIGVRIREAIEKLREGPTQVQRAGDGQVLYSMMPLVNLRGDKPASAKTEAQFDTRSFTICIGGGVERTRTFRHTRTWFKDPLTGQWGVNGQAILSRLTPALRQIVQTQTAAFWVSVSIYARIQLCYNSDIDGFYYDGEVCATFEIGFQIPIVGGVVVSGSFCFGPGGFEESFDLTGSGLLSRLQFHRRNGGQVEDLRCTNVTELDPLSPSGERTYEFQTGPCCQEDVGMSWAGEFEIGHLETRDVPVGRVDTGAPGTCPAAIPKVRVAAFIPFDYVRSLSPFDQCHLLGGGPAAPIYKGDGAARGFRDDAPATKSRLTQVLDLDAGLTQDWNPGATLNYALDAVEDNVLDDRDYDGVHSDCRLWHGTGRTIDNPDRGENFIANAGTSGRLYKYRFRQAGSNPLSFLSPTVDWDVTVTLDLRNPTAPTYSIQGLHDCFPAYEIAIDNKVVYGFMPVDGESTTVLSCLPAPMETSVICANIPLGQSCSIPNKK